MAVIAQNGPALAQAAGKLADRAREFQTKYEQMYQLMDRSMGTSAETNKMWYGPRAEGCKKDANNRKPTFEGMKKTIDALSDTLNSQVQAWYKMQTSKY